MRVYNLHLVLICVKNCIIHALYIGLCHFDNEENSLPSTNLKTITPFIVVMLGTVIN